jgi:hypothetical protein
MFSCSSHYPRFHSLSLPILVLSARRLISMSRIESSHPKADVHKRFTVLFRSIRREIDCSLYYTNAMYTMLLHPRGENHFCSLFQFIRTSAITVTVFFFSDFLFVRVARIELETEERYPYEICKPKELF